MAGIEHDNEPLATTTGMLAVKVLPPDVARTRRVVTWLPAGAIPVIRPFAVSTFSHAGPLTLAYWTEAVVPAGAGSWRTRPPEVTRMSS